MSTETKCFYDEHKGFWCRGVVVGTQGSKLIVDIGTGVRHMVDADALKSIEEYQAMKTANTYKGEIALQELVDHFQIYDERNLQHETEDTEIISRRTLRVLIEGREREGIIAGHISAAKDDGCMCDPCRASRGELGPEWRPND